MSKEDAAYTAWVEENRKALEGKPDKLKAFNDLIADDEVARNILRGGMRQEEFNRRLTEQDRLLRDKTAEAIKQRDLSWKQWETEAQAVNARLQARVEELQKRLAGNGSTGNGEDDDIQDDSDLGIPARRAKPVRTELPPDVVTRKDLEGLTGYVRNIDSGSVFFTKEMIKVLKQAQKEGFDIDIDRLHDTVVSENIRPAEAYMLLTATERTERAKTAHEKSLKEAYEKGVKDQASKQTPDDLRVNAPVPISDVPKVLNKEERRAAALKTLRQTQAAEEA